MPAPKAEITFASTPIQPGRDRGYPIPGGLRFPGDPYDPRYPRGRRPCRPCPCPCPQPQPWLDPRVRINPGPPRPFPEPRDI